MGETLKNIAALTGLVLFVVQIYKLYHGRARLTAKASVSVFHPIPGAEQEASSYRYFVRSYLDAIEREANRESNELRLETLPADLPKECRELVRARQEKERERIKARQEKEKAWIKEIGEKLPPSIFGEYRGSLFERSTYCRLEVLNGGKMEVTNLLLHVPFSGVYLIERPGQKTVKEFDREIQLGSMRSGDPLTVEMWTNSNISYTTSIRITHAAGSVPVQIGELYGKAASVGAAITDGLGLALIVFAIYVGLSVWSSYSDQSRTNNQAPAANPSPSTVPATQPATHP